ncbi:MAG: hypothetical protein AAGA85_12905 [Bacteroidota bacterium]
MKKLNTLFAFAALLLCTSVWAQTGTQSIVAPLDMYIFPANGQDADKQEFDEFQCYKWAKEQSGVDPINPPEVEVQSPQGGGGGSVIGGAAGGAAAGAAIGAIAGDAGKGAAIGATAGAFRGLGRAARRGAAQQQQAQAQAAQQEQAMINSFKKAFAACMEGKGYTVKY